MFYTANPEFDQLNWEDYLDLIEIREEEYEQDRRNELMDEFLLALPKGPATPLHGSTLDDRLGELALVQLESIIRVLAFAANEPTMRASLRSLAGDYVTYFGNTIESDRKKALRASLAAQRRIKQENARQERKDGTDESAAGKDNEGCASDGETKHANSTVTGGETSAS